jgi:hypothetical protein
MTKESIIHKGKIIPDKASENTIFIIKPVKRKNIAKKKYLSC